MTSPGEMCALMRRAFTINVDRIDLIAAGMAREGYDTSLTRYDEQGSWAMFYASGTELRHRRGGDGAGADAVPPRRRPTTR